jgi:hypothetical protein
MRLNRRVETQGDRHLERGRYVGVLFVERIARRIIS